MTLQEAHLLTNRTFTYNVGGELGTYLTDSELGVVDMDGDIQCFTYIREKIDPYINNYHWFKVIENKLYFLLHRKVA